MGRVAAQRLDLGESPSLAIRLFGPLDVRLSGAPLPRVRSRKGEWLLALLILRHDREVERSWLAGLLWPDSSESRALFYLRRELTHLRQALGRTLFGFALPIPTRSLWISRAPRWI